MCHYCHVLKNNPNAPNHVSVRCLDCGNTHSQVPMVERKYDHGKPISLLPSAPPAPSNLSYCTLHSYEVLLLDEPMNEQSEPTKKSFNLFRTILPK